MHENACEQSTCACAQGRRDSVRDRAARLVEVEHAGAHGTERGAGGKALHHAGEHERRDAVRSGEHEHCDRLHERGDDEHGATADVVGEPAGDEQAAEQRERVDAEDLGGGQRGEAPFGLVDRVEGRGRERTGQEGHGDRGQQEKRGPRRERAGGGGVAGRQRSAVVHGNLPVG